jgi:hypothetical protein
MLQRVAWLYDLKLLIEKTPDLDWKQAIALARQTHMPSLVFYALDAARRAVAAAVPPEVLDALRPSPLRQLTARGVFSDERLVETALATHKVIWAASKLVLADSRPRVVLFSARRALWEGRKRLGAFLGKR